MIYNTILVFTKKSAGSGVGEFYPASSNAKTNPSLSTGKVTVISLISWNRKNQRNLSAFQWNIRSYEWSEFITSITNILNFYEKLNAFKDKLSLWCQGLKRGTYSNFPPLEEIVDGNNLLAWFLVFVKKLRLIWRCCQRHLTDILMQENGDLWRIDYESILLQFGKKCQMMER